MKTDHARLTLNAFALRLKQALEPMNAVWAMSESLEVNQVFSVVISLVDFTQIRSISDARESEVLRQAASALADEIMKYTKELGTTPVLLCTPLILADAGMKLRIQVENPGFSLRLWFDDIHAHFDMALRGARLV